MKIVFVGTVQFSLKTLKKLIDLKADIVGVCTKKTSSINSDFANLSPTCKEYAIPLLYVDDINSKKSVDWISVLKPDIIFCFGWSFLIKKDLLNLPSMGVVGFHPTKLPQNRGRHPIIWSLVLGLKKSASTFFFLKEGMDNGDILSQKEFDILYSDDASSLYGKIEKIALMQIEDFLPKLQNGTYNTQKQNQQKTNSWRKRSKKDGQIDFRMSSNSIYNLVRGLSKPYVGAHINYKNSDIKIWKVEEMKNTQSNIEPGKIIDIRDDIITVKCYRNAIKIVEHEFEYLPKIGDYL